MVWRSADGPKPDSSYLTPADAEELLRELLAAAPRKAADPQGVGAAARTFGAACEAWLSYVEHEKDRRPSTIGDYRNSVRRYLIPEFGAATPVWTISTRQIDAFRERMLADGQLSRRSIQKILVLLHGVLKRAKRKG